ncbi:MAG: FAD-dependent oxidoreductase [Bryobacteraceae bacterium]
MEAQPQRVRLMIDHRPIEVETGTTVLEAAQRLGIRVPTLCHIPGLEPVSACFVCAVQVEGRRNHLPACALPVSEGMAVTTDSPEVRSTRKMALELLLSDHAGECAAPCKAACPAGLDIPKFVYEIANRNTRSAMEIISQRLALPGALGRICPRLCEQDCHRRDYDHGMAIGALHRYAADHDAAGAAPFVPRTAVRSGKSVAIVGTGPAGLAAAYYLLQKGHVCMLFDSKALPGGMLRYGVPEFRLPKAALDAEIDSIRHLGAEFRMDCRWGVDFSLAELRKRHDAVFLAIGAQRAQELRCEGEELALTGVEFLELVAIGNPPSLGDDVIVIGGGNTALDCARSALRLKPRSVKILYRRTQQEMPCLMEEVEAAQAEGVKMEFLVTPTRLHQNGHQRVLVSCERMELGEPDASGRRRAVAVRDSEFVLVCSTVIVAIGQAVERSLAEHEGLRVTSRGIAADERTLATNLRGVFAGGDAVLGADWAVRAVAGGRIAAASIDQFLRGESVVGEPEPMNIALRPVDDDERAEMFRAIERAARVRMPEIDRKRRLESFDEVETGLPDADAEREARRCLTCGCRKADCCDVRALATEYLADPYHFAGERRRFARDVSHPEIVYEPGKCILCDACVRIAAGAGEALGLAPIGRGFEVTVAVPFGRPLAEGLREVALQCAEVCPTGALAIRGARSCELGCTPPSNALVNTLPYRPR